MATVATQLNSGSGFASGEIVTATKLNSLVNTATVTAIQTSDISDSQVTTAKIADANVTTAKIADANVTAAKIADANVTAAKLASSAVETAKINNAAVTAEKLNGAQTGSAPIYGYRAWVNFDATRDSGGASNTNNTNRFIRASGNVASVLKNADGRFTVTFTTEMPDANYVVQCTTGLNGTFNSSGTILTAQVESGTMLAGSCVVGAATTATTVSNNPSVFCVSVLR